MEPPQFPDPFVLVPFCTLPICPFLSCSPNNVPTDNPSAAWNQPLPPPVIGLFPRNFCPNNTFLPFGLRITGIPPCGRAEQLENEIKIAWQVSRGSAMASFFFHPFWELALVSLVAQGEATAFREVAPCLLHSPTPPRPGALLRSGRTAVCRRPRCTLIIRESRNMHRHSCSKAQDQVVVYDWLKL